MRAAMRSLTLHASTFLRRDDGVMTVMTLVFFVMVMAMAGLAIDMGRLYTLNSQLEAYADEVALAAAAELDRNADAVTRAQRAAGVVAGGPLVTGAVATNGVGEALQVESLLFKSELGPDPLPGELPANDTDVCAWTSAGLSFANGIEDVAECSAQARFVQVIASPRTANFYVLPIVDVIGALFGAQPMINQAVTSASATGGFKRTVCNNVPLMICNPSEFTQGAGAEFTPVKGQQILAKVQGSGQLGPGNFGVLDADFGNGFSAIREAIAKVSPNTSCVDAEVDTQTGAGIGPLDQGFNVRFDMYNGAMSGVKNNPNYAAAANVTKGQIPKNGNTNSCSNNLENSAASMPFPRDTCFTSAGTTGCTLVNGEKRFGASDWDRNLYWNTNHKLAGGTVDPDKPANFATMTRFELYEWEIANGKVPHPPGGENGNPVCNAPASQPAVDRRVLMVAVVNCSENAVQGSTQNVPVEGFAEVFLTEPVGNTAYTQQAWPTTPGDIYIEMIGKVQPSGANGVLHEYPVLYR